MRHSPLLAHRFVNLSDPLCEALAVATSARLPE